MARPRSPKSQAAIQRAAIDLLESEGWAALTVEGVAARAGVGKQTIYRWYDGDLARVVVEAYVGVSDERVPPPDTGSTRDDLVAIVREVARLNADRDRGLALANRSLMAHAQLAPAFAEDYRRLHEHWRRTMVEVVERGAWRGDVPAGLDAELVVDLLLGLQWYRLLVGHRPTTAEDAEASVDAVLGERPRSG